MKKYLLILLSILFVLTGCTKKISWQDVESTYNDVTTKVNQNTKDIEIITKEDYTKLLDDLNNSVESSQYSQDEANQNLLKKSYEIAQYISAYASLFDGNCAQQLISLAGNVKNLVISGYDGDKDQFEKLKNSVQVKISEINSWQDNQWSTVEKKAKIAWESVANAFEQIENKAKNDLTDFKDLAEIELEELKHTIIDNYELVKDGITSDTDAIAKNVYAAAIKLEQYTRRITTEKADTVWQFAKDTQSFIKTCYGKVLEEGEGFKADYTEEIAAAKKWTQSTWNEITRELKLLAKNSQ